MGLKLGDYSTGLEDGFEIENISEQEPKQEVQETEEVEDSQQTEEQDLVDEQDTTEVDENEESTEEELDWVEELNKMTQLNVEGEYEDDLEGISSYIKTANTQFAQQYQNQFFEDIKAKSPVLFDLINMAYSPGGNVEQAIRDLSTIYDSEDIYSREISDEEVAEQVIYQNYKDLNLSDAKIKLLIEADKDEGNLVEKANMIQEEIRKEREEEEKAVIEQRQLEQKQLEESLKRNQQEIEQRVSRGTLKNFIIPEDDKANFFNWLNERLIYTKNGTYAVVKELVGDNLDDVLASEYFNMKGADLNKLIAKKAETQRAGFIKNRLTKSKNKVSKDKPSFDLGAFPS